VDYGGLSQFLRCGYSVEIALEGAIQTLTLSVSRILIRDSQAPRPLVRPHGGPLAQFRSGRVPTQTQKKGKLRKGNENHLLMRIVCIYKDLSASAEVKEHA
jgi:hypothetical protein